MRTLVTTGSVSSQRGETLRLQGARGRHALSDLEVSERFVYVPADFPRGDPFHVGQMYALFAEVIHTGQSRIPTFDMAVELHRFIATIQQASDTGHELPVACLAGGVTWQSPRTAHRFLSPSTTCARGRPTRASEARA